MDIWTETSARDSSRQRLVIVSRDNALVRMTCQYAAGDDILCICAANCYEAAALVLSEHSQGLLLDLRCLSRKHIGLLEIARQTGVRVFGIGQLPHGVSTSDLSGLTLIARHDLEELPRQLGPITPVRQPEAPLPAPPVPVSKPVEPSVAEVRPSLEEPPQIPTDSKLLEQWVAQHYYSTEQGKRPISVNVEPLPPKQEPRHSDGEFVSETEPDFMARWVMKATHQEEQSIPQTDSDSQEAEEESEETLQQEATPPGLLSKEEMDALLENPQS